ncbi:MAG: T9SS type A sorting domain-containing protein [candidate division WOR-3 bacterium]|nr:T9SS type A sorting domain-containing protein [candidate division WOR-3 bacterium]
MKEFWLIFLLILNAGLSSNSTNKVTPETRPLLNGEFLIDTVISYFPAPFDQKSSSVVFDGTNFFIVWEDYRGSSDANIYGSRINQAGAVLEPFGIIISRASNNQSSPAVAFDGNNYFVVWQDYRNGNADIYGARINTAGVLIDTNGIPISTASNNQAHPSIAFDGTNYLVVWDDTRTGGTYTDIYAARVSISGVVLDTGGILISNAVYDQSNPAVAFDGTNYLVVWQDNYYSTSNWDIMGARVTPAGVVLDPNGFSISYATNYQWYPAVAFDGTNYLVVWGDRRSGPREDIYGARVSRTGAVLDPDGFPISTAATNGQYFPAVAFDGTNYLVVWDDYRSTTHNIYGARVTPAGTVLDPNGRVISNAARDQLYPAVAFGATNYFVCWDDYRSNTDNDIYGARVSRDGSVVDMNGILISSSLNYQLAPAAAFDGTNYLVVWEDARAISYSDVYGARISPGGIVLNPISIGISTATNDQMAPAVAFDGTNYLVVWEDKRSGTYFDIYGTRVDQSGTVLNPSGIIVSNAANHQESPALAFDGTNYLVVWQDKRGGTYYDIYGTRIDRSGTVLNPSGIAISTASLDQVMPAVAFDGTNYLEVWEYYRNSSSAPDIYCTRGNTSGTVLNPAGIAISTASQYQMTPCVTFGGGNYLVVWIDMRNGNWDIYGARVNPSGTVLDPSGIPICTNTSTQMAPAVGFDGVNYVVVWQDMRNGSFDIYGAQLNISGAIVNTFVVSTQSGNQIDPVLAIGPAGQIFTAYSGFTDYINGKPVNNMRIWGSLYTLIGLEEISMTHIHNIPKLLSSTPNPFSGSTEIKYYIRSANVKTSLNIYDINGNLIKRLVDEVKREGWHSVKWDGKDEYGRPAGNGVYISRLRSGNLIDANKIILVR